MLAASAGDISDDGLDDRALQDGGEDESASESESDDESWSCPDFVWKRLHRIFHIYICSRETRVSKLTHLAFPQISTFSYLLRMICWTTLLSTRTCLLNSTPKSHPNLGPHSNVHKWVPTIPNEMKKFIGLLLIMGVVKKPEITLYWSTDGKCFDNICRWKELDLE